MPYGTVNADKITTSDGVSSAGLYGFKNRIINGAMVIDQRNAGASVTPTAGVYSVDRWAVFLSQASKYSFQRNAASVTPPAGFTNYLGITSTSAYSATSSDFFFLSQSIEGFNVADLGWGAAGAQTVTLSFWVRSSLTGTFGGAIRNGTAARNYPFTFTISSANTWTNISITVAGDTSGTWATDNSAGLIVSFGLGAGSTYSGTAGAWAAGNIVTATGATSVVGTNGATFYITGVQLEKGSTATSFDYRPYGTELQLCQRYYEKSFPQATAPASSLSATGANVSSATKATTGANQLIPSINFKATKRAVPSTVTAYSPTVAGAQAYNVAAGACSSTALYIASDTNISFTFTGNAGGTIADIIQLHWTAEAEL
jgi:hypothetical protein